MSDYRIYVACLAAYNNGKLHGEWIDAAQDPEDIQAEVDAMLAASPEPGAEEWAIHDFEMGGIELEEYTSFETVAALALALEEHGPAFAAFYDNGNLDGIDPDEWDDQFSEYYRGEYSSEEEYAEELTRECYTIPDFLEYYVDWSAMARDMFINDNWSAPAECGGIYVFHH